MKKNPCLGTPKNPYKIGAKVVVNVLTEYVNEPGVIVSYASYDYDYVVETTDCKSLPCWHEEISITPEIAKENARNKLREFFTKKDL